MNKNWLFKYTLRFWGSQPDCKLLTKFAFNLLLKYFKMCLLLQLMHTVLPWIVAGAIINFEGNFARKYFVNFWESNCSSRSVIEMMRHFDMKRYPREWGKKFIHYFGEAIIRGGATIQGNTVCYVDFIKSTFDKIDITHIRIHM